MSPHVSVLMTVYNGERHLPEAIESVLRQTFRDFELLVVDDASTDESLACIRRYPDRRIRLIRNERNLGQVRSLNIGLERCHTPYVARLDQDDVCLPDRLARQVEFLERCADVAVVGTRVIDIDVNGRRLAVVGRRVEDFGTFAGLLLLGLTPLCHPSVMFRREVIAEVGGYDESCAPAEDVDLWTNLALRRRGAAVIPEPLVLRRVHAQQQSATKAGIQQEQIHAAQQRLIEALCPRDRVRPVTLLLRRDDALWTECPTRECLQDAFTALHQTVSRLNATLQLSAHERKGLWRVLDRWFGPGVRLANRMAGWPSALFYPVLVGLSPVLVPGVRHVLSRVDDPIRRLRGNLAARWSVMARSPERPGPAPWQGAEGSKGR